MVDPLSGPWGFYLVMLGPIVPAVVLGALVKVTPKPALVEVQEAKPKASWLRRFFGWAIDMHIQMPFLVLAYIGHNEARTHFRGWGSLTVAFVLYGVWYLVGFYNRCIRMGTLGYSWGHQFLGIKTVSEETGEPTGVRRMYMREQFHYLDQLFMGFLWPLFDKRRRTIADKLARTITFRDPTVRTAATGGVGSCRHLLSSPLGLAGPSVRRRRSATST